MRAPADGWGGELLGREGVERLVDAGLALADADGVAGVEVVVAHDWSGHTRFASSQIHQNAWTEDVAVNVRVVTTDGRVGVSSMHTDDPAQVIRVARQAVAIARLCPPDPEFPGLAPAAEHGEVPLDRALLETTPEQRAAAVRDLLDEVPDDLEAAGALQTGGSELGVYTSAGQRAYSPLSSGQLTLVVLGPTSSGFAETGGRAAADIDGVASARTAVRKARAGADPVALPAGVWPVVLEPAATGTLVQFLGYLGFGGRDYLEGRSFAAGRMGEKICDPAITIADDALAADTIGYPFDWEGTPKQKVVLVDGGRLAAVVHDRHTGARAGSRSTGHGLPAPNTSGPIAMNPVMECGDGGSIDDVVAGCERGLLVTRFHYTNVVHPRKTILTGMTRDGTFLVEDGELSHAVRNLRFTQPILAALSQVEAVSTETGYGSELFFGGSRYPALRLPAFTFTSTTSFG